MIGRITTAGVVTQPAILCRYLQIGSSFLEAVIVPCVREPPQRHTSGRIGFFETVRLSPSPMWQPVSVVRASRAPPLLDHLVGGRQQRFRDGEAECLGGLEVDDQFDSCNLLNR
jgi:hypothetical protein